MLAGVFVGGVFLVLGVFWRGVLMRRDGADVYDADDVVCGV